VLFGRRAISDQIVALRARLHPEVEKPGISHVVAGEETEQGETWLQSLAERLIDPEVLLGRRPDQTEIDDAAVRRVLLEQGGPGLVVLDAKPNAMESPSTTISARSGQGDRLRKPCSSVV
jgi:hypothetical protein